MRPAHAPRAGQSTAEALPESLCAFTSHLAERFDCPRTLLLGPAAGIAAEPPGPAFPGAGEGPCVICGRLGESRAESGRQLARVRVLLDEGAPVAVLVVRVRSRTSLADARELVEGAGLEVLFHGLAPRETRRAGERDVFSVVRRPRPISAPPASFRVLAIVGAYNEEDVILPFLEHTISQGVEVCLLDNWSTDRTVERARRFLGRGVTAILKFPDAGPNTTHAWRDMLVRKSELAARAEADWFIHLDPDEIRESPWPDLTLRESLYRIGQEGFNAIDHTCAVFHPTGEGYRDDEPLQAQFRHFEFGARPGHFLQVKAWKRQPGLVDCAASGGHLVRFPGRRVYPFKFLLRHYPIRSQEHGERKVFRERLPRFSPALRQLGWHQQYDALARGHCFVREPRTLLAFDPGSFYEEYLVERLSGIGIARTGQAGGPRGGG